MFARNASFLLAAMCVAACGATTHADRAPDAGRPLGSPARLSDGRWRMRVDREWDRSLGHIVFPSDPLEESDYRPMKVGAPIYPLVVSGVTTTVAIGEPGMTAVRVSTEDGRVEYELRDVFAGGRFVVWPVADGLQAELTIYGSGVPVIRSERGALVPDPWSAAAHLPLCLAPARR